MPVAMLAVLGLVSLVTITALLPTSRPDEEPAAYAAGALSATGAFAEFTYIE